MFAAVAGVEGANGDRLGQAVGVDASGQLFEFGKVKVFAVIITRFNVGGG